MRRRGLEEVNRRHPIEGMGVAKPMQGLSDSDNLIWPTPSGYLTSLHIPSRVVNRS
jgi:hypothetical protein